MTRTNPLALAVGVAGLLLASCGDDRPPPPSETGNNDGGGIIINPDCEDAMGPMVSITTPTATSDPSSVDVLIGDQFTVICEVMATMSLIDDESVVIAVEDSLGAIATPIVVNNGDRTFQATLDASSLTSGAVTIGCLAQDTAIPKLCNQASIESLLDLGPTIEVLMPSVSPSRHSGSITIEYTLTVEEIVEGADPDAAIVSQTLEVAGKEITPTCTSSGLTQTCTAVADFTDAMVFSEPVEGDRQFEITATNGRGTVSSVTRDFTRDSLGPSITILEPSQGSLIGGTTDVVARVTDPSGVNVFLVSFSIRNTADGENMIGNGDVYSGSFDASRYPSTSTEITIDVTAVDQLGNAATVSVSVKLDSVPPIAELDPPNVRESREGDMVTECSWSFDPVGDDAPDDGEVLSTVPVFRVRAQDRGNNPGTVSNPAVITIAGIDPEGVQLFILDDWTQPLVVDTDGDPNSLCDEINPDVLPVPGETGKAVVIDLHPIDPIGTSFYNAPQDFSFANPDNAGAELRLPSGVGSGITAYEAISCQVGMDTDVPLPVCDGTLATRVIGAGGSDSSVPTIYAEWDQPGSFSEQRCMGDAFDPTQSIDFGWACAAVRVADRQGNATVSAPIRVCFEDPFNQVHCPGAIGSTVSTAGLESCVQACTPERYSDFPGAQFLTHF